MKVIGCVSITEAKDIREHELAYRLPNALLGQFA